MSLCVCLSDPGAQQEEEAERVHPYTDSIYVLYLKNQEGDIEPIATTFAISDSLALTAGHTVAERKERKNQGRSNQSESTIAEKFYLAKQLRVNKSTGKIEPKDPKEISVRVRAHDLDEDWAVLERTDGTKFPEVIPVATDKSEGPKIGTTNKLTFYHCPIGIMKEGHSVMHVTPKVGSVGLIDEDNGTVCFQNGGFDGSCGGPYVYLGKAIGFHTDSTNTALTSEALKAHDQRVQNGPPKKKNAVAIAREAQSMAEDAMQVADSASSSHASMATGILIYAYPKLLGHLGQSSVAKQDGVTVLK